jgi:heterodisulfide reductase subunit B
VENILYYPGCTVKRNAIEYEKTGIAVFNKIGINVVELDKWYCCGGLYSLALDDLIKHLGAVRTLIYAERMSSKYNTRKLFTLCPMCFNVLKRVNKLLKEHPEKLETISRYLADEDLQYQLSIEVVHAVEVLRDHLGELKKNIVKKPPETPITVYYGCTIVRPREIGVDNPENPVIIENMLRELGFNVVDIPYKTFCCGAFHILDRPEIVHNNSSRIIDSALRNNASIIVTVCPLCHYNLEETRRRQGYGERVHIIYLTELLAYAMGLDETLPRTTFELLNNFFQAKPIIK